MANKESKKQNSKEETGKALRQYARYSNLAFKWIAVILVGFFGGMKLDKLLHMQFPVFTLVLAVSGLFLSLYLLIKELKK